MPFSLELSTVMIWPAFNFRESSLAFASLRLMPDRFGSSVLEASLRLTTKSTAPPSFSLLPAVGSCLRTMPSGLPSSQEFVIFPTLKFFSISSASACDRSSPATSGTGDSFRPRAMVRVILAPSLRFVPARGSIFRTVPGVASLSMDSSSSTRKPFSSSTFCASATGMPLTSGTSRSGVVLLK